MEAWKLLETVVENLAIPYTKRPYQSERLKMKMKLALKKTLHRLKILFVFALSEQTIQKNILQIYAEYFCRFLLFDFFLLIFLSFSSSEALRR